MIERLRKCNTIDDIVSEIIKYYSEFDNEYYIPGIYQEGSLITTIGKNADFYAKLIIRPSNYKLEYSWLKNAIVGNFVDGSTDIEISDLVYNLITYKKFYNNEIYMLNPNLIDEQGYIYEKIQDDKLVANQVYFNSSFSTNEWPVLIADTEKVIKIFKYAISDYIGNKRNVFPQYKLSVEFEYRDIEHIINEQKDVFTENYYIHNTTADDRTNLVGTIDLDFVLPKSRNINILTNGINGEMRIINENNWNDDMDPGLIVFNKKCLKYLKKRYIFVELHMIDMFNQKDSLVDIVNDYVVFWEGEFNQLPYEVKKEMEQYNIQKKCSGIISKAMYEWQLCGNRDYDIYEDYYMRLSKKLYEDHLDLVKELRVNLDLPNNKSEFIDRIKNIEKICKIKIENLNLLNEPKEIYQKIMNTKYLSTKKELRELYDYLCFKLLEVQK